LTSPVSKEALRRETNYEFNNIIQNIYQNQDKITEILNSNKIFNEVVNEEEEISNNYL